jgi:hypothetical protein
MHIARKSKPSSLPKMCGRIATPVTTAAEDRENGVVDTGFLLELEACSTHYAALSCEFNASALA